MWCLSFVSANLESLQEEEETMMATDSEVNFATVPAVCTMLISLYTSDFLSYNYEPFWISFYIIYLKWIWKYIYTSFWVISFRCTICSSVLPWPTVNMPNIQSNNNCLYFMLQYCFDITYLTNCVAATDASFSSQLQNETMERWL